MSAVAACRGSMLLLLACASLDEEQDRESALEENNENKHESERINEFARKRARRKMEKVDEGGKTNRLSFFVFIIVVFLFRQAG